eukprot:TRINITY_DN16251_c0_g1_i1.p1 TRINITY_DN16251_c0_g1~~TRINITY_DN16251_c0_g1_i1.p1  ORF type:complete len:841 (-),score=179.84 TRINITY_DN16251_c0_g1_i1:208-2619(-)
MANWAASSCLPEGPASPTSATASKQTNIPTAVISSTATPKRSVASLRKPNSGAVFVGRDSSQKQSKGLTTKLLKRSRTEPCLSPRPHIQFAPPPLDKMAVPVAPLAPLSVSEQQLSKTDLAIPVAPSSLSETPVDPWTFSSQSAELRRYAEELLPWLADVLKGDVSRDDLDTPILEAFEVLCRLPRRGLASYGPRPDRRGICAAWDSSEAARRNAEVLAKAPRSWTAALDRMKSLAKMPEFSQGVFEIHAMLSAALGPEGAPVQIIHHLFRALSKFVQKAYVGHEMLVNLLRLLPSCESLPESTFRAILDACLVAALHPPLSNESLSASHVAEGRCVVADALLQRYPQHMTVEQLAKLCYPLGALELCLGQHKKAKQTADETCFKEALTAALSAMGTGMRSSADAESSNKAGKAGRHAATSTSVVEACPLCSVFGEPCPGQGFCLPSDGWKESPKTVVETRSCGLSCEELASQLHHLCWKVGSADVRAERRWQLLLERLAALLTTGPVVRLWLGLVGLEPGLASASAAADAIGSSAGLPDAVAAKAADALWKKALAPAPSGKSSWLSLPSFPRRSMPERVRPPCARRPLKPALFPKPGLRRVGAGPQPLKISEDGLQARHTDDTGEQMCGVLMGMQPLTLGRAGAYFEVLLEEVRPQDSCCDGLTIGVTATAPESMDTEASPATAEHIPETWAVGYDGQMWDATANTLCQVGWDPRTLAKGDVVGVLITAAEGELIVFRNGVACCPGPRAIPVTSKNIYPVVDLLGHARAVRWLPDAEAPGEQSEQSVVARPQTLMRASTAPN